MTRQSVIIMAVLGVVLLTASCSKKMIVNIDGMPIPNYEVVAQHEETGLRISYILASYHKQYEGDEYFIVPKYLNTWDDHVIDPSSTESLVLHIKVVNLKKVKYNVWYELEIGDADFKSHSVLYHGKLSRKDFPIVLPMKSNQKVKYRITFVRPGGDEIYEIGQPFLTYKTKGGASAKQLNSK